MRHIAVQDLGSAIRLRDNLCVVENNGEVVLQEPLSRISSITISKGASITSDVILACAARGIQVHFIGWNGLSVAAIDGLHTHAVVALRKKQFETIADDEKACTLSKSLILGKVANQRAVLLYFDKYHTSEALKVASQKLLNVQDEIVKLAYYPNGEGRTGWRYDLLGLEGKAAVIYWRALRDSNLLGSHFDTREGRGSLEPANQALNYGYAILGTRVWQCVTKAGLEPYAGFIHTDRPGKASLVLDVIELFRAWIVDRSVIKVRTIIGNGGLTNDIKNRITREILSSLKTRHLWHGKKLMAETILQRQVYSICGAITSDKPFKAYHFKW